MPHKLNIAPPCQKCGHIFVAGQGEVCVACLRRKPDKSQTVKNSAPVCDCGKRAVTVIWVQVGEDGLYQERMALCKDCLRLEKDLFD